MLFAEPGPLSSGHPPCWTRGNLRAPRCPVGGRRGGDRDWKASRLWLSGAVKPDKRSDFLSIPTPRTTYRGRCRGGVAPVGRPARPPDCPSRARRSGAAAGGGGRARLRCRLRRASAAAARPPLGPQPKEAAPPGAEGVAGVSFAPLGVRARWGPPLEERAAATGRRPRRGGGNRPKRRAVPMSTGSGRG